MQEKVINENKMGVMPIGKLVLNMSLPMVISMLVMALYNIVDSVYVGRISEEALASVAFAFPLQNLMIAVGSGTAVGINALLSRALGSKDFGQANKVAENGIFLALLSYVAFLLFGLFGVRLYITSQTQVTAIVNYSMDYLSVVCCFSFGLFGQMVFERLMQSTGRTFWAMCTQGLGAVINIILDPIFIFTLGYEVKGAAIATVIGQIVAFIAAMILNHVKNPDVSLKLRGFRPNGRIIGRIYAIGLPSIAMIAIGSVMTYLMNKILVAYTLGKETAVTFFGLYFKINSFVFMPVFGLNNGVIPIIAYNYGAQNRKRLMQALRLSLICAISIMAVGMLIFMIFPEQLLRIFTDSEKLLEIGVPALRLIATTFIPASICIVVGSIFQALGRGMNSLIVSIARQLLVLVPAAFFLARYGQNVGNDLLVWVSYPVAEISSLIVTLVLFSKLYKTVIRHVPEAGILDAA